MKAWLLDQIGGLQHLRLGDAPDPVPGPGEAVLQLHYAALNPADRYLAEGNYPAGPPMPHILGRDGIGTVLSVGAGVTDVHAGDVRMILRCDVGVTRAGTFAQRVAVPADALANPPEDWTEVEAGGAALVYLTAWQALNQWGALDPSVVLVSGASGGVGVASVQLAAAMGHTVIALSRSPAKREHLKELGAAEVFDPQDSQWSRKVKDCLAPRRVALAIDNIGGTLLPQMIDTLGAWGKVSIVGRLAGPVPQFNTSTLLFRRIRMGGVAVGAYTTAESHEAWHSIVTLMRRAGAKPLVDRIFPFAELPAAFARLADGPMGKVLLDIQREARA